MELDNRKNEVKDEFTSRDIAIEVFSLLTCPYAQVLKFVFSGINEQVHRQHQ